MCKKSLLMYTVNRGTGAHTPLGVYPCPCLAIDFLPVKLILTITAWIYSIAVISSSVIARSVITRRRDRTQAKCTPSRLHSRQGHKGRRIKAGAQPPKGATLYDHQEYRRSLNQGCVSGLYGAILSGEITAGWAKQLTRFHLAKIMEFMKRIIL